MNIAKINVINGTTKTILCKVTLNGKNRSTVMGKVAQVQRLFEDSVYRCEVKIFTEQKNHA